MAETAFDASKESIACLRGYSAELAAEVRKKEEKTDHYEDMLGTYLVQLSKKVWHLPVQQNRKSE